MPDAVFVAVCSSWPLFTSDAVLQGAHLHFLKARHECSGPRDHCPPWSALYLRPPVCCLHLLTAAWTTGGCFRGACQQQLCLQKQDWSNPAFAGLEHLSGLSSFACGEIRISSGFEAVLLHLSRFCCTCHVHVHDAVHGMHLLPAWCVKLNTSKKF